MSLVPFNHSFSLVMLLNPLQRFFKYAINGNAENYILQHSNTVITGNASKMLSCQLSIFRRDVKIPYSEMTKTCWELLVTCL